MRVFREFQEFAIKGNVIDMAVGIIIGAAFTTVVKSLVDDLMRTPRQAGRSCGYAPTTDSSTSSSSWS